jgi:hypothetical protein
MVLEPKPDEDLCESWLEKRFEYENVNVSDLFELSLQLSKLVDFVPSGLLPIT